MSTQAKSPEEWVRMAVAAGDEPHLICQAGGKRYLYRRLEGWGPDAFPEQWQSEIINILIQEGRVVSL